MCVNSNSLMEIDIYNRILRFENYFIAMVQKGIIDCKFNIPILGEVYFMPRTLQFLLKCILFDHKFLGAFDKWYLKLEYKHGENKMYLAKNLEKKLFYFGLICLGIFPIVLIVQVLHTIYYYFAYIRSDPSIFTVKRWSNYAKVSLRHYNELDHELNARLSRGYKFAKQYSNSNPSKLTASILTPIAYVTGIMSLVAFLFGMLDSELYDIEHMLLYATILGGVTFGLHKSVPDKNIHYCSKKSMNNICNEVHYLPEIWKEKAHTSYVRNEFSKYFQYTIYHIIESLLSPILTPLIFMFKVKNKSLEIVDFLQRFTIEVPGVGDICLFSQLDVGKQGNHIGDLAKSNVESTARPEYISINIVNDDKTELSLLNFTRNNSNWKPPPNSEAFLSTINEQSDTKKSLYIQKEQGRPCGANNCIDNKYLNDVYLDNIGGKSVVLSAYATTSSIYCSSSPPLNESNDNFFLPQNNGDEASNSLNFDPNTVGDERV